MMDAEIVSRRSSLKITKSSDIAANYDYCMVFKLKTDQTTGKLRQSNTAKYCVNKMKEKGLETFNYLSVQRDELIVLIRCPPRVMKEYADSIDFKLALRADKIKEYLEQGIKNEAGDAYIIKPVHINSSVEYSNLSPYNYIYGKYDTDLDQELYEDMETDETTTIKYDKPEDNTENAFNRYVRLKLTDYILKGPERLGGCDLEISKLIHKKRIETFYPLHERSITQQLATNILKASVFPWTFPFDDYRSYFGEKLSLFMVFLGHYSKWLIAPSIVGIIFQFVVWGQMDFSSPVLPFFCVLISIWAIVMLEYWKQEEKTTALKWGMLDFEQDEPDRPEFYGDEIVSFIDGSKTLFFSPAVADSRLRGSQTIVVGFITLVLGVLASIYTLRFSLQSDIGTYASLIATIANTIQITVFNMIYQKIAVRLTQLENHRTDTQYEDSLILKQFVFQFVNSYASFFFLAFIAQNLEKPDNLPAGEGDDYVGQCGYKNCMQPLSINLAIIFGTRLVLNNTLDLVIPWYNALQKRKAETKDISIDTKLSPPEEDYILMQFNDKVGNIENYADAAIQFGFSTLFVSALPIAPFLSLVANYVRAKVIAWKLLKIYQRPIPTGAEDIGSWLSIFQILSVISVITNAALVCFTMEVLSDDFSQTGKVWLFLAFQWTLLVVQFLAQQVISDTPEEVEIQQKRMKFIISKIIDRTPDENITAVEEFERTKSTVSDFAHDNVDDEGNAITETNSNAPAGCLAICFPSSAGGKLKKRDYKGCPEIIEQQYSTGSSMTSNPMGSRY